MHVEADNKPSQEYHNSVHLKQKIESSYAVA